MRFLVNEKSYETPIAAGILRYMQDGEATGAVEAWRFTHTDGGDQILRVDLDLRGNEGGSFLYHLVLEEGGAPQRLTYRYIGRKLKSAEISGNILFTPNALTNSRKSGDTYRDEELPQQPFFFPTTIGLGWLARQQPAGQVATLDMHADNAAPDFLSLRTFTPTLEPQRTRDIKRVKIGKTIHRATTLTVKWADQSRKLWLSRGNPALYRWPLKMERQDGLTAVETRLIQYQTPLR